MRAETGFLTALHTWGEIYRFIFTFTASSRRAASRPIINAEFARATCSSSR